MQKMKNARCKTHFVWECRSGLKFIDFCTPQYGPPGWSQFQPVFASLHHNAVAPSRLRSIAPYHTPLSTLRELFWRQHRNCICVLTEGVGRQFWRRSLKSKLQMALSRSGTASALNLPAPGPLIPTGNEPSQDVDKALQNAIHARYLGRYCDCSNSCRQMSGNKSEFWMSSLFPTPFKATSENSLHFSECLVIWTLSLKMLPFRNYYWITLKCTRIWCLPKRSKLHQEFGINGSRTEKSKNMMMLT